MRGSSISTLKLCFGFPGLSSGFGRRQWGPKSLSVEKELWEISYDTLAGKKSLFCGSLGTLITLPFFVSKSK